MNEIILSSDNTRQLKVPNIYYDPNKFVAKSFCEDLMRIFNKKEEIVFDFGEMKVRHYNECLSIYYEQINNVQSIIDDCISKSISKYEYAISTFFQNITWSIEDFIHSRECIKELNENFAVIHKDVKINRSASVLFAEVVGRDYFKEVYNEYLENLKNLHKVVVKNSKHGTLLKHGDSILLVNYGVPKPFYKNVNSLFEEIYVMQQGDADLIKIGKSTNPLRRLSQIRTSNPSVKLVYSAMCLVSHKVEKHTHNIFSHKRFDREWFNMNPNPAIEYLKGYWDFNNI